MMSMMQRERMTESVRMYSVLGAVGVHLQPVCSLNDIMHST